MGIYEIDDVVEKLDSIDYRLGEMIDILRSMDHSLDMIKHS